MANKKVSQLTSKPSVLTTDLFPIADPSTGQLYKTTISDLGTAIGSGVSSVNSLVGAVVLDTDDIQELVSPTNKWFTDTRARAALSASSPLTYNSGTGAFGIQVANGSQNGYLSSADWTTFNAKQAALSGTGFVKISGTTISYDNSTYLTTSSAASTYLPLTGGTLTGALQVNGYLSAQVGGAFYGDVVLSGTNPKLYFTDTDNNPDYFISNTDGTFTVYDATNSVARFTIGTTGNATFTNAITGGGSITGQSLYSNGIISAGTSLSVGTFVSAGGSLTGSALYVTGMTAGSGAIYHSGSRLTFANYNASGTLHFEVNGGVGALTINADKSADFENYISANSVGSTQIFLKSTGTGANRQWQIQSNESVAGDLSFMQSTAAGGSTYATKFNIGASGAATFSSSVTAASAVLNFTGASATNPNILTLNNSIGGGAGSGVQMQLQSQGTSITGLSWLYDGTKFDSRIDAYGDFVVRTNGSSLSERLRITSSGNVGIGTTSPSYKLSVEGTAGELVSIGSSTQKLYFYPDSAGVMLSTATGQGGEGIYFGNTSDFMFFQTANNERMRIKSNGIINFSNVPTSSAGLSSGDIYKTVAGVLMIV